VNCRLPEYHQNSIVHRGEKNKKTKRQQNKTAISSFSSQGPKMGWLDFLDVYRDKSLLHRSAHLKIALNLFRWTQNYSKLMLHYLIRVDSY